MAPWEPGAGTPNLKVAASVVAVFSFGRGSFQATRIEAVNSDKSNQLNCWNLIGLAGFHGPHKSNIAWQAKIGYPLSPIIQYYPERALSIPYCAFRSQQWYSHVFTRFLLVAELRAKSHELHIGPYLTTPKQ